MLITGWGPAHDLLNDEITLRKEQGCLGTDAIRQEFLALDRNADNEQKFLELYAKLKTLEVSPEFRYEEPSDLEAIRAVRPAPVALPACTLDDDTLLDRLHGGWTGRAVGCALGKPVEGMGMGQGFRAIRKYLENRGQWPLRDFFSLKDVGDGMAIGCPRSCKENIQFMEEDDDICYSLIGLLLLEIHGKDFTSHDVAELWNHRLPMAFVCTAERQALLNYNIFRCSMKDGFERELLRTWNNPYREWIGAQIRADFFGFASPGKPEQAAEFAWRDASWTHERNGIYGEMFIAAVEAAAFVTDDPLKLVEAGLAQIPANCRLAEKLRRTVEKTTREKPDVDAFMTWVEQECPDMSPVHTINNAMICVYALLMGGMDPDRTVETAVSCGYDTDCNGATTGAITGLARGFRAFGGTLAPQLHDTIQAEFSEFMSVKMADLAKRSLAVVKKINQH